MYRQRNRSKTILHVIAALLMSAAMAAAAIPGLCNTGLVAGCTGPAPINGNDGNWQIAFPFPSAPSTVPLPFPCSAGCLSLPYEPAWVDSPDPAWLRDNSTSQWITPNVVDSLGGQYIYAITFPVPAGNGHVTIVGALLSDNEVYAIFLNSGSTATNFDECIAVAGYPYNDAAVNSPTNFIPPWTTFKIVKEPVTAGGTATLYFVVRNRGAGGVDSNPTSTGLRVQFDQPASGFSQ